MAFAAHNSPTLKNLGHGDSAVAKNEMQDGVASKMESELYDSKKLQDDLKILGLRIKHHEDNIQFLKTQKNKLDDSIQDLQVILGKYHLSNLPAVKTEDHLCEPSEEEIIEHIMRRENSAAGILCQLKTCHATQTSQLPLMKDVLGIVAMLGKIEDDNLNRILSEYLGLETMLAVVCKTLDGVKSLETYAEDGSVNRSSGLHGLSASIGRPLRGRFRVICLQNLRPYTGEFVVDDPKRRLDLFRPKLPNGESPPGFLGFAVNMINVDMANLYSVAVNGDGLRESLFYSLFSRLQVYRTRAEMLQALPCISDGAISLDGGLMRNSGVFSLGTRGDTSVKFQKCSKSTCLPENYLSTEKHIKEMTWRMDRMLEDMQTEQALLDNAKFDYEMKKQEFLKFLAESSIYATQAQAAR